MPANLGSVSYQASCVIQGWVFLLRPPASQQRLPGPFWPLLSTPPSAEAQLAHLPAEDPMAAHGLLVVTNGSPEVPAPSWGTFMLGLLRNHYTAFQSDRADLPWHLYPRPASLSSLPVLGTSALPAAMQRRLGGGLVCIPLMQPAERNSLGLASL